MKHPLVRDVAYGLVALLLFILVNALAQSIGVPDGVLPR